MSFLLVSLAFVLVMGLTGTASADPASALRAGWDPPAGQSGDGDRRGLVSRAAHDANIDLGWTGCDGDCRARLDDGSIDVAPLPLDVVDGLPMGAEPVRYIPADAAPIPVVLAYRNGIAPETIRRIDAALFRAKSGGAAPGLPLLATALALLALLFAFTAASLKRLQHTASQSEVELAALRRRAIDAERSNTVGATVLGLSDDFADMLTTVRGALGQIASGAATSSRQDTLDALRDALDATERGIVVTRRLSGLAAARPEAIDDVNVGAMLLSLRPVLERTVQKAVHLVIETEEPLPPVQVSQRQFEIAVLAMVRHGAQGLPEGGSLFLRTARTTDGHAMVEVEPADGERGAGDAMRARSSDEPVDLTPVEIFARSSGGFLDTRADTPGRIALVFAPADEETAEDGVTPIHLRGGHILLVDGDGGARRALARMLRSLNYRVTDTASGDTAMGRLTSRTGFDAVITAVSLPGILQGPDLIRAVAEIDPGLPVLMTSTRHDPSQPATLVKPIHAADLDRALRPALARRQTASRRSPLRDITSG